MKTMNVIKVTEKDIKVLQNIGIITFRETFEISNSKEDMYNYLNKNFSLKKLKYEIRNLNSEFYFAKINKKVIGYIKVNFGLAQTEIRDNKSLEIERIYILNEYQKKRIGQQLFEFALKIAKKRNYEYIWLGVWEENIKAINFYKKNGFIEFDKHIFRLGNDEQTDIIMKLKLD